MKHHLLEAAEKTGPTPCILGWKGSDPFFQQLLLGGLIAVLVCGSSWANRSEEDLGRRATWTVPSKTEVQQLVQQWLDQSQTDENRRAQIQALWTGEDSVSLLDTLAESFAVIDPEARALVNFCQQSKSSYQLPGFDILSDQERPAFVRNNLRLLYARWLAHYQLYNEVLEQIGDLQPSDVVDPAGLLFYQSVAHHRLLQKDQCLPVVERLMENEDTIPRRYVAVARLIQADIQPLKPDSLDEVSRLMDSIKVRLGHGRAGTRVRKEEDDVVAKLDKMIDQLEQQASQSSSSGSGSQGGTNRSSSPMQDSMPAGGSGPGNVDAKKIGSKADWGNLPAKEREQALQELGKDFPSHYRDVIEEYFRKLARDGAE